MAALRADRKEYTDAFHKHQHAYLNWKATGSDSSKRLILAYCVECGLKSAIMQQQKIFCVSDAQEEVKNDLGSHDYRRLLKRLNQAAAFSFPVITTKYHQSVSPERFHELCRYCIPVQQDDSGKLQQFEQVLNDIMNWLKEQI